MELNTVRLSVCTACHLCWNVINKPIMLSVIGLSVVAPFKQHVQQFHNIESKMLLPLQHKCICSHPNLYHSGTMKQNNILVPYSQHFIFFVTYESAQ
jgi:hypothetical protein